MPLQETEKDVLTPGWTTICASRSISRISRQPWNEHSLIYNILYLQIYSILNKSQNKIHFICYFISNQSFHGNLQYLINHKYIINQNLTNKKSSSGITSKTAIFCDLKFQCRATLSLSVILQSWIFTLNLIPFRITIFKPNN